MNMATSDYGFVHTLPILVFLSVLIVFYVSKILEYFTHGGRELVRNWVLAGSTRNVERAMNACASNIINMSASFTKRGRKAMILVR